MMQSQVIDQVDILKLFLTAKYWNSCKNCDWTLIKNSSLHGTRLHHITNWIARSNSFAKHSSHQGQKRHLYYSQGKLSYTQSLYWNHGTFTFVPSEETTEIGDVESFDIPHVITKKTFNTFFTPFNTINSWVQVTIVNSSYWTTCALKLWTKVYYWWLCKIFDTESCENVLCNC